MCRLVAYLGRTTLLKDVLVSPENSIIMQSLHARETILRINGDGFGVGWYAPQISSDPAIFTSISPAWNDQNLLHLTAKIQSPCFFAHVRSASSGGVAMYNCHPFVNGDWMLMHNGEINNFVNVKRHLRHLLDDDVYDWIKGSTDSEHFFALFFQLAKGHDLSELSVVAHILQETMQAAENLVKKYGRTGPSYYNFCLTDGRRLVATRYCSSKNKKPLSLHYLRGCVLATTLESGENEEDKPAYVVVSSERLNDLDIGWEEVPAQSMILIDEQKTIELRSIQLIK